MVICRTINVSDSFFRGQSRKTVDEVISSDLKEKKVKMILKQSSVKKPKKTVLGLLLYRKVKKGGLM